MLRKFVARSLLSSIVIVGLTVAASAGTFEVKTPDITKGQTSFSWNNATQSGFPVNAEPTRHSSEFDLGYSPTSWLFIGSKLNLDQAVDEDWKVSTGGAEMQVRFGKARPGFDFGWYSGVDLHIDKQETNTFTFGPIIQFGDDKASLTLNPFLQQTFGINRDEGIAFAYGVMAKKLINDNASLGIEAYGVIPDIGGGTPVSLQEHRIGPVLYLETEIGPKRDGREAPKATLDLGIYFGMTEATADLTGKAKFGVTW